MVYVRSVYNLTHPSLAPKLFGCTDGPEVKRQPYDQPAFVLPWKYRGSFLFYFFLRGNLLAQAACTKGVCLLCSSSWALPTPSDRVRVVHWQWHGIFPASVQEGHLLATPLTGLPLPRLFYCGSLQPEQLPRTLAGHPYCGRKGDACILVLSTV